MADTGRIPWRIAEHMNGRLSKEDVAGLLQDPSAEARADAAAKIATHYDAAENFGAEEKKLADKIFSIMCRGAEERVRQALVSNLKECVLSCRMTSRSRPRMTSKRSRSRCSNSPRF